MHAITEETVEAVDNMRRSGATRIGILWSPLHACIVERDARRNPKVEDLLERNAFGRMLRFAGCEIRVRDRFDGEPVRAVDLGSGSKLASDIAYAARGYRFAAERIAVAPDDHALLLDYLDFLVGDEDRVAGFAFRRRRDGSAVWYECFGMPIESRDLAGVGQCELPFKHGG